MPARFHHNYVHDVFVSYTHIDDQPDVGCRWVTRFVTDLRARLEIVSGRTVSIWRDEQKLGAADRFNDAIAKAVRDSAVLLVVLSPAYFNSKNCLFEREEFHNEAKRSGSETAGGKARILKIAKFCVGLDQYPPDLRELLEHRFYVETPGSKVCREFHLSADPLVQKRYDTKVDDVAQELAALLSALEPARTPSASKGLVYLAETTSDLEPQRDDLRRHLVQLGYDVEPRADLRLLPWRDLRQFIADTIRNCSMAVHPIGAYYGFVPEGSEGKSVVQIQLDLARTDSRNGNLTRIIWVPDGLIPQEESQKDFLERLRTEYAGRGFELLERPYNTLASRIEERLKTGTEHAALGISSGIYLVCDNVDRALAKTVKSFLFNQRHAVEWTPATPAFAILSGNSDHERLLRRNGAHLVLHGATDEGWLQDRIHELDTLREQSSSPKPVQAIYLADPRRQDKDDILVRDIALLEGYTPDTVGGALIPFLERLQQPGASGDPA